jgi:hypothetical protein
MNEITHSTTVVDVSTASPLFPLGRIVVTPGALDIGCNFTPYLAMHECGLWGEVGEEDWQENDLSVKEGYRILSAYVFESRRFWIISEADRSATSVLLPEEY